MSRGITYVAWGKCIPEAERSALSARKFNYKSCLITTEPITSKCFDKIIKVNDKLSQNFNILNTYELTPWDQTLWLDSDTLILGNLDFAFEKAQDFGISIVIAPHSCLGGRNLKNINQDSPEYNCGAMWIDKHHPKMMNFGDKWKDIVKNYNGRGWWTDQSSVSYAIHKLKINPFILPLNWNFRAYMDNEFSNGEYHSSNGYGPIKVWHSRTPLPKELKVNKFQFWKLPERK
tara:strand:- start:2913 stop:3608 length:696 start_codon:yes stop_codon:yes gene_type:complete